MPNWFSTQTALSQRWQSVLQRDRKPAMQYDEARAHPVMHRSWHPRPLDTAYKFDWRLPGLLGRVSWMHDYLAGWGVSGR